MGNDETSTLATLRNQSSSIGRDSGCSFQNSRSGFLEITRIPVFYTNDKSSSRRQQTSVPYGGTQKDGSALRGLDKLPVAPVDLEHEPRWPGVAPRVVLVMDEWALAIALFVQHPWYPGGEARRDLAAGLSPEIDTNAGAFNGNLGASVPLT